MPIDAVRTLVALLALGTLAAGAWAGPPELPGTDGDGGPAWTSDDGRVAIVEATIASHSGWTIEPAANLTVVDAEGFAIDRRTRSLELAEPAPRDLRVAFAIDDARGGQLVLVDQRSFSLELVPPEDGSANRTDAVASPVLVTVSADPVRLIAEHFDQQVDATGAELVCGKGVTSTDGTGYAHFGRTPTATVEPGSTFLLRYASQQDGCPEAQLTYAFLGLWDEPVSPLS